MLTEWVKKYENKNEICSILLKKPPSLSSKWIITKITEIIHIFVEKKLASKYFDLILRIVFEATTDANIIKEDCEEMRNLLISNFFGAFSLACKNLTSCLEKLAMEISFCHKITKENFKALIEVYRRNNKSTKCLNNLVSVSNDTGDEINLRLNVAITVFRNFVYTDNYCGAANDFIKSLLTLCEFSSLKILDWPEDIPKFNYTALPETCKQDNISLNLFNSLSSLRKQIFEKLTNESLLLINEKSNLKDHYQHRNHQDFGIESCNGQQEMAEKEFKLEDNAQVDDSYRIENFLSAIEKDCPYTKKKIFEQQNYLENIEQLSMKDFITTQCKLRRERSNLLWNDKLQKEVYDFSYRPSYLKKMICCKKKVVRRKGMKKYKLINVNLKQPNKQIKHDKSTLVPLSCIDEKFISEGYKNKIMEQFSQSPEYFARNVENDGSQVTIYFFNINKELITDLTIPTQDRKLRLMAPKQPVKLQTQYICINGNRIEHLLGKSEIPNDTNLYLKHNCSCINGS